MTKIDLHIHSINSADAEFSVEDIMEMCEKEDMKIVSISDHNTVRGVDKAIKLGIEKKIKVLSGIEIDCVYDDINFHLLGYGFDYTDKRFLEIENYIVDKEKSIASEKIYRFKKATDIDIKEEEVFDIAQDGIVTGEIIAEIVLNRDDAILNPILKPYLKGGDKSDMPYVNFYWDFFAKGKQAYVPVQYMRLNDAKNIIHETGGISVLAHPGQNLKDNFQLIDKIIKEGIKGIEVFSSYHSISEIEFFYDKAIEYNLVITCGSDFHGKNKPQIKIGDCDVNDEVKIINQFN